MSSGESAAIIAKVLAPGSNIADCGGLRLLPQKIGGAWRYPKSRDIREVFIEARRTGTVTPLKNFELRPRKGTKDQAAAIKRYVF